MTREDFEALLDKKFEQYFEELDKRQPTVYKYVKDIPEWGRASVQKCVDKGYLIGTGTDSTGITVDISHDLLRTIVLNDRAGIYDSTDKEAKTPTKE